MDEGQGNVAGRMGKRKHSEVGGSGPGHTTADGDAGEHGSDVEEDERPTRRRKP